ncbi:dTDP-glucose pyrophosphorylase [Flavobacteriaceae bacterium Ap0902]|nr:dTDP-glucose pyrophosphorylase [Flavobacteriaceae bacterium Ap0902]
MMNNFSLLVLAGGLGSRYKGQKQVDPVGPNGEALMEFALHDSLKHGVNHVIFIINNQLTNETRNLLEKPLLDRGIKVDFCEQRMEEDVPEAYQDLVPKRLKPWGTGHAVLAAKDVIHQPFIVMNADDYYGEHTFELAHQLLKNHKIDESHYGLISFILDKTLSENGHVSRGVCKVENGKLVKIDERTKIAKEDDGKIYFTDEDGTGEKIELEPNSKVSMNFWVLHPSILEKLKDDFNDFFKRIENKEKQEFYLPKHIDRLLQKDDVTVWVEQSNADWFGMTYPEDREVVVNELQKRTDKGDYPSPLWK